MRILLRDDLNIRLMHRSPFLLVAIALSTLCCFGGKPEASVRLSCEPDTTAAADSGTFAVMLDSAAASIDRIKLEIGLKAT